VLPPRTWFWARGLFLVALELECGAAGLEGFALAGAVRIAPVSEEFAVLFEHGASIREV